MLDSGGAGAKKIRAVNDTNNIEKRPYYIHQMIMSTSQKFRPMVDDTIFASTIA